jgi:LAGLIDADG-like domain
MPANQASPWSEDDINDLRRCYATEPTRHIASRLGRSPRSVIMKARRIGLWKIGHPGYEYPKSLRRYLVPDDLFSPLNTRSAYLLGFICADGDIQPNRFRITNTDRNLLARMLNANGLPHPIGLERKGEHSWYRVSIADKQATQRLRELGLTATKALNGTVPPVPDDLFWHFLRGFFDGDGSVHSRRSSLLMQFTSASLPFLSGLAHRVALLTGRPVSRVFHDRERPRAGRLIYCCRVALALADLMYADCGDLFMSRKRAVFEEYRRRVRLMPRTGRLNTMRP